MRAGARRWRRAAESGHALACLIPDGATGGRPWGTPVHSLDESMMRSIRMPYVPISVVIPVYNCARYLTRAVGSILHQDRRDIEVIAVDDGSTDGSGALLQSLARTDQRLRVLQQPHVGVTTALIRGCAAARGTFIARQDADDISASNRLRRLASFLEQHPDAVLVSSGIRVLGPQEEVLVDIPSPAVAEMADVIAKAEHRSLIGGAVMFRAAAYRQVDGYHAHFRFAEDLDLHLRLMEVGTAGFLPDLLYGYRIQDESVTRRYGDAQIRYFVALAQACAEARRQGISESPILETARRASYMSPLPRSRPESVADTHLLVGRLLLSRGDWRARSYFWQVLKKGPDKIRSAAGLLLAWTIGRWPLPS